jgi:hypothetical protein
LSNKYLMECGFFACRGGACLCPLSTPGITYFVRVPTIPKLSLFNNLLLQIKDPYCQEVR